MKKFLAVVKFEYTKIIFKWSFLIGTFLLPLIMLGFALVPALIFSIRGEAAKVAVVDRSGRVTERLKFELSPEKVREQIRKQAEEAMKGSGGSSQQSTASIPSNQAFVIEPFEPRSDDLEQIRTELSSQVVAGNYDAYLIVPDDIGDVNAVFEFRSRRSGDVAGEGSFRNALNAAVRSQRMADANIDEARVQLLSQKVNIDAKGLDETGNEKDSSGVMAASFIIGLMIYITLAIYGQAIMGAVVEEKETRIAEILFSSATPFQLMMGKLVGVGLAGLTQLTIWIVSAAVLVTFLAMQTDLSGIVGIMPPITPLMIVFFLIFFLLGYFAYAAIFALIGAMVTTVQEGGQFAFPPILLLLTGFYLSFAVIRDPNSSFSFWASIAPFFAPITMPVRILAETPPMWHILLAIVVNTAVIAGLVWLAGRIYRVGMLMYGKRTTIPEAWRWLRQS